MAVAVSCMSMDMDRFGGDDTLSLSGSVYSKETSTPAPINGIRVIVNSYNRKDTDKTTAITRDTVYTDETGNYAVDSYHIRNSFYVIEAHDIDGEENGGQYNPGALQIVIGNNCRSMEHQDFYLSRK